MNYLESPCTDPAFNLALEEYLLQNLPSDARCLYLWQNDRSVIVGRFQNALEEVDASFLDRHGIPVVRRLTGGGAVYHDLGNLNFSLHVPAEDAGPGGLAFPAPILEALESLGIEARPGGRNDLLVDGRKICGCAQTLQESRLLFHGCIMVETDLQMLENALRVRESKIASHGIKSVRSRVTTVNAHSRRKYSVDDLATAIRSAFSRRQLLDPLPLSAEDLSRIRALAREKYASWDWNYGDSPACTLAREQKFPAGLVSVRMDVNRGRILRIRLRGDFFGDGDISELEDALAGSALDGLLPDRLRSLGLERYMRGISAEELASLLR